jgi:hypothetical protein
VNRRLGVALLALLGLLGLLAGGALSANTITVTPPATGTFADNLNGLDQSATYSLSVPISYTSNANNKNATLGWHLTATSTTLKGNGTARTLSTTASKVTAIADPAGCTLANCTDATNSATITYPITIPAATAAPAAATVFWATAGSGAGGNTLTMQVSVAIPANTYADTYASTMTLAVIEGP